ncbi:DUF4349 domain-containing protein [Simiduia agarivorans]|uniref:DUF4349 domain-containing protein n=1 Tax=Simiduia agarivorans (strain DSM 21679 / JCM 13881 / BCRC 17597 / SA1) TaxID=1117647 RepID=K4L011_SIMAS|nr:DUF4349 domain-containing protein [Simiduia agarivorans]AFU99512.2 hypothetical protein M5M_11675 [Simiduia agarivorans SA1 = DSM 21679]
MRKAKLWLMPLCLFLFAGCSSDSKQDESFGVAQSMKMVADTQRGSAEYLAYEHRITVRLARESIEAGFNRLVDYCGQDRAHQCTVLHASVNTGDYARASLRMRLAPAGVEPLIAQAAETGDLNARAMDVEDLQTAVADNSKRMDMLIQYQSRLQALEKESAADVDALIRVAGELARVQSDIEYAQGEKAALMQRIQMDIVNISLEPERYGSFFEPIAEAASGFGENLSNAIAFAITGVAYSMPWLVLLIFLIWLVRKFWLRRHTG